MHPRPALRALTLALALGLAAGQARAEVQGFHYTREAAVPAAGWVRVPLDIAAVQHLASGAADLHAFSPVGEELPIRIEPATARTSRRPAAAFRVEPAASDTGGWLSVDVGADPLPHERLLLTAVRSLPDRVESSPDGSAWRPLAGKPGLEAGQTMVSYPVTTDRYLRLHWRRRPEAPSAVAVEGVTVPVLSITTTRSSCEQGPPGALFCTLPLPAAGQSARRLALDVEGKGVIGYRLYAPREALWIARAEEVWQPGRGRTRHLVTLGAEPLAGSLLRLELYGAGARPRLVGWGAELTVQTVLFRADAAGRYILAYGGARRRASQRAAPPFAGNALWVEPGPERAHELPFLPLAATAPAVRLTERRLAGSWRVAAPGAKPGSLVRLELPPSSMARRGPTSATSGCSRETARSLSSTGRRRSPRWRSRTATSTSRGAAAGGRGRARGRSTSSNRACRCRRSRSPRRPRRCGAPRRCATWSPPPRPPARCGGGSARSSSTTPGSAGPSPPSPAAPCCRSPAMPPRSSR